jgi:hypothetical protein
MNSVFLLFKTNTTIRFPYIKGEKPVLPSLKTKILPTLVDRGCHVVSATDPHGSFLG